MNGHSLADDPLVHSPLGDPEGPPVLPADPGVLAARIRAMAAAESRRVLVGIAGPPGAGKSTLAAHVVAELGDGAVLVPMDGYHLAQRVLARAGLVDVKGAPETFDAAGYLALLHRLARPLRGSVVYAPEFRREIEEPIAGALAVPSDVRVVVTEGNYLLLDEPPWDEIRLVLDETWYLDTADEVRLDRLVGRHVAFGRTPAAALDRAVGGSDGANARLVAACRDRADVILRG